MGQERVAKGTRREGECCSEKGRGGRGSRFTAYTSGPHTPGMPRATARVRGPGALIVPATGAGGLVYAPPRLGVCVCERVWRGQRRTLCSGRGQRPGAKLGIVSSCLGQMLPGRDILTPFLNFLGTWDVVKPL